MIHRRRAVGPQREPLPTRVQDTPPLPPSYEQALLGGLADLGLEADLADPAVREAIDGHVRLLLAWTQHINLTAIREPAAVAIAHVLDSLSALPWLRDRPADRVLDLGSGGGYPGLPLAAALPDAAFTLAEPIAKKARFLRAVVDATGSADRVTVLTARAEELAAAQGRRGAWSVVTARAVASTADLVELSFPLLTLGGSLVAWKRGDLSTEFVAARRAIEALGGGTLEVLEITVPGLTDHRLAIATRTGTVPDAYPRDPAARRHRPW